MGVRGSPRQVGHRVGPARSVASGLRPLQRSAANRAVLVAGTCPAPWQSSSCLPTRWASRNRARSRWRREVTVVTPVDVAIRLGWRLAARLSGLGWHCSRAACRCEAVARAAAAWAACCWAWRNSATARARAARFAMSATAASVASPVARPVMAISRQRHATDSPHEWHGGSVRTGAGRAVVAVRGAAQFRVARPAPRRAGCRRPPMPRPLRRPDRRGLRAGCAPRPRRPDAPRDRRSRPVPGQ